MAESDMHYNEEPTNMDAGANTGTTPQAVSEGSQIPENGMNNAGTQENSYTAMPNTSGSNWGVDAPGAAEGSMPADFGTNDNWGPASPAPLDASMPADPGTNNNWGPASPAPLDASMPADPGTNNNWGAVSPAPLDASMPADPGANSKWGVTTPIAAEGDTPMVPGVLSPCWPSFPLTPPTQYYGMVRFLNASTNSFPVNISIGGNNYAINSRFGTVSNYDWVPDGFQTVTVRRGTGLRTILYQNTFPFIAGERVTMVLIDSGSGLDMIKVSDQGCSNMPYNTGCYRVANMSYSGSRFDVLLLGNEAVFRNVGFGTVTSYKQAMAGSYQFYVTNSNNFTVLREIPIIVIGAFTPSRLLQEPLVSYQVDIEAGRNYTSYIIGNTWSDSSFRVLTVEDF